MENIARSRCLIVFFKRFFVSIEIFIFIFVGSEVFLDFGLVIGDINILHFFKQLLLFNPLEIRFNFLSESFSLGLISLSVLNGLTHLNVF